MINWWGIATVAILTLIMAGALAHDWILYRRDKRVAEHLENALRGSEGRR